MSVRRRGPLPDPFRAGEEVLRRAYRILYTAGVVALLALGLMAWLEATPGNGLGLVALLAWAVAAAVAVRGRPSRVLDPPGPAGGGAIEVRLDPVAMTLGPEDLERARRLRDGGATLVEIAEALRPGHAADPAIARGAFLSALERALDGP